MGKTVKTIAAVVGIAAIFIPGVGSLISAGLTSLGVGAGIATAIVTGLGMSAISFGSPVADMIPDDAIQSNAAIPKQRAVECMLPLKGRWHLLWLRYRFIRITGRCMTPHVPNGRFLLVDRQVDIRAGDMVSIKTDSGSVAKRFVQLDAGCMVVETTEGCVRRYRIPLDKVRSAYRCRASGATRKDLVRAIMNIRRNPESHMEMLGAIVAPKERVLV